MEVGLVVPVMVNFKGFTELMRSVDRSVTPLIIDNWNENIGVSKGWNEGIRQGFELDALVIANDDVVFCEGTINRLVDSLGEADLVSAVASDTGQDGLKFDEFPDFCCFAIRPRQFVDKFGWFDENFSPAYFEDNDMHYRIKVSGGTAAMHLAAQVHHSGSVTQFWNGKDDGIVSHQMFEDNRTYYTHKWGGRPGEEQYTTPFGDNTKTIKDW